MHVYILLILMLLQSVTLLACQWVGPEQLHLYDPSEIFQDPSSDRRADFHRGLGGKWPHHFNLPDLLVTEQGNVVLRGSRIHRHASYIIIQLSFVEWESLPQAFLRRTQMHLR